MSPELWGLAGAILALLVLSLLFRARLSTLFGAGKAASAPSAQDEPRGQNETPRREAQEGARAGALDLHDLEVSDIMVHRTNMKMVNGNEPTEALVRDILQSPYTRIPVWKGTTDNIVGIVNVMDLLRRLHEVGSDLSRIDISRIMTRPTFVPDTTTLQDQLNAFLRRKSHCAIVVDEYGEVEGLVTIEDIIAEIVGDIADERDIEVQGVKQEADGSVVVEGSVPIRDLNRALNWSLPDEEATTVAGLVIHESQSIPDEKQAFTFHGKRFVVMKRDRNRIARLRIRPVEAVPAKE